jgi:hypothetical protein
MSSLLFQPGLKPQNILRHMYTSKVFPRCSLWSPEPLSPPGSMNESPQRSSAENNDRKRRNDDSKHRQQNQKKRQFLMDRTNIPIFSASKTKKDKTLSRISNFASHGKKHGSQRRDANLTQTCRHQNLPDPLTGSISSKKPLDGASG